jgi:hypothetical protein
MVARRSIATCVTNPPRPWPSKRLAQPQGVLLFGSGFMQLYFIMAPLRAFANVFDANLVALHFWSGKKKQNQECNKL